MGSGKSWATLTGWAGGVGGLTKLLGLCRNLDSRGNSGAMRLGDLVQLGVPEDGAAGQRGIGRKRDAEPLAMGHDLIDQRLGD